MTLFKQLQFAAIISIVAGITSLAHAAETAGNIIRIKGDVNAVDAGSEGDSGRLLSPGDTVFEGEKVVTGAQTVVQLQMIDGAILVVSAESVLVLQQYDYNRPGQVDGIKLRLEKGRMRSITGKAPQEKYSMDTTSAKVTVAGTVYDSKISTDGVVSTVILREGAIVVESTCGGSPTGQSQVVDVPGMSTTVAQCSAPTVPTPEDEEETDAIALLDEFTPSEDCEIVTTTITTTTETSCASPPCPLETGTETVNVKVCK